MPDSLKPIQEATPSEVAMAIALGLARAEAKVFSLQTEFPDRMFLKECICDELPLSKEASWTQFKASALKGLGVLLRAKVLVQRDPLKQEFYWADPATPMRIAPSSYRGLYRPTKTEAEEILLLQSRIDRNS